MREDQQEEHNDTRVTEFILLGFPGPQSLQMSNFMLFLIMYLLILLGNMAIILLVITNCCLHTPMYFFLCNLSFLEIWYTTASIPKILAIFLGKSRSISFTACVTQMYFIFSLGSTEHFMLSAMAYDRYLAISSPLHYNIIMDTKLCSTLAFGSWLGGFLAISILTYLVTTVSFCGTNVINNFYCNIDSWLVLSCSDTYVIERTAFVIALIVILSSCSVSFISYMYIISTILHIPNTKGQQKAFSTCSSHLVVLIIWYGSTTFLFAKPFKHQSLETNKIVNVFTLIVVPLLNPFIYTLRNKEVKDVLRHLLHFYFRKTCAR
ncbi:olfactory receptor 6F1-like [Anolis sagrei]|uniref:olfactory receptor 6F1-like n=1 Tax=Anolis sagrei TaxID=38937 RepID=UPI0035216C73